MKTASLLALSIGLMSHSVWAITGGTSVNWQNDFDDVVNNNCTGLIVGGNKILTAAHCLTLYGIEFSDGSIQSANSREDHPNYNGFGHYDFSIWTLSEKANTQNIHFFANLNNQTVQVGDDLKAFGFGGNNPLSYAEFQVSLLNEAKAWLYATPTQGDTIAGDSGGMWLNASNNIVAILRGGTGTDSIASNLHYAKDFLLEHINGWHYPTVLKGTGTQTIQVQSLHINPTADSAYVDGDVTITGGTCYGNNTINAFDTCTYELDVNGTGTLHLSGSESISINPKVIQPEEPSTPPSSGGSGGGGSMGWLSLLALAVFGRFRNPKA